MNIYKITNALTNKCYVGKTKRSIEERFKSHKANAEKKINRVLYDTMNKYGIDNFKLELIESNIHASGIDTRERFWINYFNCIHPNGMNMTSGGDGGYTLANWTEEDRNNLYKSQAEKRLGQHYQTKESKAKSVAGWRKAWNALSEEEKTLRNDKIRNTLIRKGISPPDYTKWKVGQVGLFLGKNHTEETRLKMKASQKGMTWQKRYGDNYEAIKAKQIKRVKEENGMMIKVDNNVKIEILEFIKDNIDVGLIEIGKRFNLSRFKIKSVLIDFDLGAYNTERKLNKTNWVNFIQNKIDLFKEKTDGT